MFTQLLYINTNINMKIIWSIFLILFTLISCSGTQKNNSINDAKYEVDIDAFKNEGVIPISSYFESVKPIFLETNENCLIQSIDGIQVIGDYFFILDRKYERLYCFDKDGKFVRRIGNLGSGPGEFSSISDFTIDNNRTIYTLDRATSKIHLYALTGEYISSISLKNIGGNVGHIQVVEDFLYLDYQPEKIMVNADTPLLLKVDKASGEIVDKYLSASEHNLGFQLITFRDGSFFYSKNSNTPYYAPIYSNTVFSLNDGIEPYFRIKSSRLLQKEDLEKLDLSHPMIIVEINRIHKVKSIKNFLEIKNYIFCQYFDDRYGSDILLYCKNSGKANLYDRFFDDYFYKTVDKSLSHFFVCSDEKGIFAYMPVESVPLFMELHNSENVKFKFDQQQNDLIQELSEELNPILFYYELR